MRVELNTNVVDSIVPDTYGTEFCYYIRSDCWEDFKQGMIYKAEEYLKDMLSETDFVDAKLEMLKFESPREYNFETDSISFALEFDDSIVDKIAKFATDDVKGEHRFIAWLKQKYRSYDGFICTMPDSYREFMNCLNGNKSGRYQWRAFAAYLSYQISMNFDLDKEQRGYIDDCWEYASQNGMDIDEEDEEESIC